METYILKKAVTFEDGDVIEIDVNDVNEIRDITKSDAILDKRDGYCKCYGCETEFDLHNEKEADRFYSSHNYLFDVNDFEVYECDEVYSADC